MTSFRIDSRGDRETTLTIREIPGLAEQVARRTVAAVTRWAGEELADQVATSARIPRSVLLQRNSRKGGPRVLFRMPKGKSAKGGVWFGADPVPGIYLGDAIQTDQGVIVSDRFLPGAFLAKMASGHVGIFERRKPLTKHSRGRPVHWVPNLPIKESTVSLNEESALLDIETRIPDELIKRAAAEMKKGGAQ